MAAGRGRAKEWTLVKEGKARKWRFYLPLYFGREIRDRLHQSGYTEVKRFGSFAGEEYGASAQKLIAVTRKPPDDRRCQP